MVGFTSSLNIDKANVSVAKIMKLINEAETGKLINSRLFLYKNRTERNLLVPIYTFQKDRIIIISINVTHI